MVDINKIKVTFYKDVKDYNCKPQIITMRQAFARIIKGESKDIIEKLKLETDKEKAKDIKSTLPGIVFSGEFSARGDKNLVNHSGFVILDFDKLDVDTKKTELRANKYIFACWTSPSGNGVKALVRIKDVTKHREHLKSIFTLFPEIDKQNINEERICFESYDPEIWVNKESEIYTETIEAKKEVKVIESVKDNDILESVLKWLSNRGDSFIEGERNLFIYKMASACCRFGLNENETCSFCKNEFSSSDFANKEIEKSVASAYRNNLFGSAEFKNSVLVNKSDKKEVEINSDIYNLEIKPQEIIFGDMVKCDALKLYENGYESIKSTGIVELDEYFKFKKGEIILLSGYGNTGKSTYMKYLMLMQVLLYDKKICIYSPEEYPAHEFYHDFVEIYLGCNCLPSNPNRPTIEKYAEIYDMISKNIFYVYPTKSSSTPEYIKQVFLEMVIKENVEFCVIDPFNQLDNDYNAESNVAKYLEKTLKDFSRFAIQNQICFLIINHPKSPKSKESDGNYPCPDVFDIADGSMWNNKMDDILIFHKPYFQTDPDSPICEHWSKKIKRQKVVGKRGNFQFDYDRKKRRFIFNGRDYIQTIGRIVNNIQQSLPYKDNNDFPVEPPF